MAREKTGGRQAGTPNKNNKEFKEKFQKCLLGKFDKFIKLLDSKDMTDKDKLSLYLKALEFVLPKQKAIEHSGEGNSLGTIQVQFTQSNVPPVTSENDDHNDD